jgi:multiple sugar transport system ATP-binding protein
MPVVSGRVELVEPLGSETHVVARVGELPLTCKLPARCGLSVGDSVSLEFDIAQMKIFDRETGRRLA